MTRPRTHLNRLADTLFDPAPKPLNALTVDSANSLGEIERVLRMVLFTMCVVVKLGDLAVEILG